MKVFGVGLKHEDIENKSQIHWVEEQTALCTQLLSVHQNIMMIFSCVIVYSNNL